MRVVKAKLRMVKEFEGGDGKIEGGEGKIKGGEVKIVGGDGIRGRLRGN